MQPTEELLSALLDGELATDDLDRLMAALDAGDGDLGSALGTPARWSALGSVMRGADVPRCSLDLLDNIRSALASEPSPTVVPFGGRRSRRARWMVPVGGMAAAASLAIAAVLLPGVMQQQDTTEIIPTPAVAADDSARRTTIAEQRRSPVDGRAQTVSSRREEQLNTFHIEYAGYRTVQGVGGPLGYARFAAHNTELRQSAGR